MSRTLSRLLALGATAPLLGAAIVVAAPAAQAAVLPTCSSTPVYDFTVAGQYVNRLAVDTTATDVRICFSAASSATGVLVVHSTVGVNPPTVTQTPGTLPCAQPVWDSTQPVALHVSVGADASGRLVCLSLDGQTTVVSVGLPSVGTLPGIELWRTGTDDLLDFAACLPQDVQYVTGGSYNTWSNCLYSGPTRIV
jgi:hypothetical protein